MDQPTTSGNPTLTEKTSRLQWWAAGLIIIGLLCALVPLVIYFEKYLTRQTVTDRLLLIDYHECPTIMLGIVLLYLGIVMARRRSAWWVAGIGLFYSVAVPTVWISEMNYWDALLSGCFLVFTILDWPKPKAWHYGFPFLALFISAILTPNIHWASVREDVSSTQAAMRFMAELMEKYHADHHAYPPSTSDPAFRVDWKSDSPMPGFMAYRPNGPAGLTTPVAYLDRFFPDDFRFLNETRTYSYYRWDNNSCILIGAGPNCIFDIKPEDLARLKPINGVSPPELIGLSYDPTNGTVSPGDIVRVISR